MPELLTQLRQLNRDIERVGDERRAAERRIILACRVAGPGAFDGPSVRDDAASVRAKYLEGQRLSFQRDELRVQLRSWGTVPV